MLSFYLILLGMYLYYSKSKYFPDFLFRPKFQNIKWLGLFLLTIGTACYIRSDGWAGGLILSLVAFSLAMILVQLFAVLGRFYFYGLLVTMHVLLLLELISYAS